MRMKALKMFTVNSPRNGAILHGDDRKEADAAARYPNVSEDDAAFLEREGYAEPYDGKVDGEDDDGTGLTIDERAGVMVEGNADAEGSVEQTTGLSTRDTTAFERPIEEIAGVGSARTIIADDGGTAPAAADEAPASGGTRSGSRGGRSRG